ncbi:WG repeat-containing protein [Chitinophaga solisilvae]|uniref:WG repeat-containing protein n=1 Tax=Chitinophaga solisilvae TaxID=1233460 RepID=UPI00136A9884|nr:WG repeat-containing protein [Chitinophaga solisilvae]
MKSIVISFFLCCPPAAVPAQAPADAFPVRKGILTIGSFCEGLARMEAGNNRYGYMNTHGTVVISPRFEAAGDFHEGLASVGKEIDGRRRFGFINRSGRLVIPYAYDEVKDFSGHRAAVSKNGVWQYISTTGHPVLNSRYVRTDTLRDHLYSGMYREVRVNPMQFRNGLLLVRKNNLYGYTDTAGNWRIPPQYRIAREFADGVALVSAGVKNNRHETMQTYNPDEVPFAWGVIDPAGKLLFTTDAEIVGDFSSGLALFNKDDLWGFFNKKGETVFPARFDNRPLPFTDSTAIVQTGGETTGVRNGKLLLLHASGSIIAVPLCNASGRCILDAGAAFSEKLLPVKVGSTWGYMDTSGNMAIPPQFDQVTPFREGLATVITTEGRLRVIRHPGKNNVTLKK